MIGIFGHKYLYPQHFFYNVFLLPIILYVSSGSSVIINNSLLSSKNFLCFHGFLNIFIWFATDFQLAYDWRTKRQQYRRQNTEEPLCQQILGKPVWLIDLIERIAIFRSQKFKQKADLINKIGNREFIAIEMTRLVRIRLTENF